MTYDEKKKGRKEFVVEFSDEAEQQFNDLPEDAREEIMKVVERLKREGPPPDSELAQALPQLRGILLS